MLTIGQLAAYAGVTIRAVRHYHQIGLLPEPGRDTSGYRSYDAAAVVRLVRIRTLAEAGVPLVRVRGLLDADPETFAAAIADIDRGLRDRIRALRDNRRRIALLPRADTLAVPPEVVDYLGRLRGLGVPETVIGAERDAYILMAARWPDSIPAILADKVAQLADPDIVSLYRLAARAGDDWENDEFVLEAADLMTRLFEKAEALGELDGQDELMPDQMFIALMDSFADAAHPAVVRIRKLIAERGWTGWTKVEKRHA
ncbi:MerR family transcriptional regulator [Actinoplanes sp. NPDC049265]|uniref:MerR family transcriptional regulator n=1 Tax=Actinoplanes sp. NPDC049265 TaxID=3363902 RepID=UPI003722F704